MRTSDQQILEMIAVQLGVRRVAPEDRLVEELGAESADLLNLVANLEERYGIEIDEEELPGLVTVEDVRRAVLRRLAEREG